MDYQNQAFEGVEVLLDGNNYRQCSFDNVVFVYSGGALNMENCNIQRFSFRFDGQLANGLYALYQLFGTEGMLQIIRGFTEPSEGEIDLIV